MPFGSDPASLLVDLRKPLSRQHINFERGSAAEVEPDARFVSLADGQRFRYDKLIDARENVDITWSTFEAGFIRRSDRGCTSSSPRSSPSTASTATPTKS